MAKKMKAITLLSTVLMVICYVCYINKKYDLMLTLTITFCTISYHFIMRLLVGFIVNLLLNNHMNYHARWFQVSAAEQKIYNRLKVKKWKGKMGTYDPSLFDSTIHSWNEIVQAMCQAEIVHEIIILLSFVPVFASIPFGAFWVFMTTSILAACYDATFVIMQRYNRPRIIKLFRKSSS